MKKRWKNIRNFSKGKQFQIVFSVIMVVVSIITVILNCAGVFQINDSQLLSFIVILLCSVVIIYVLDEVDFFEQIKGSIAKLPDNFKEIESKFSEETKSELVKIEENAQNIQNQLKSELVKIEENAQTIQNELLEVHKCVKDTHTTKGVIVSRKKLERSESLDEVWNGADEIYLLAIANTSFLKGNGISKIKDAVKRGVRFKMVSLNPDFSAITEYEQSGIISETSLPVSANVNEYIKQCSISGGNRRDRRKETRDFNDMVEFRLTTYLLPYSMMIVKKHGKINKIKVDLYGLDMDYLERRSFYIPADDEENINFYEEQWKTVWEDTQKTIKVDMGRTY